MMDETGAVEEDVDRPDPARERLDRFVRAHIELTLISLEAGEATDVDVGRDDPRALAGKGLGRRAAYARRRRGQQRHLTRQSSRHVGRSLPNLDSTRPSRVAAQRSF